MPSQIRGGKFRCGKFRGAPWSQSLTPRQSPQCVLLVCEKFVENPEFRVGNVAINLKREISHAKSKCHEIPPPRTVRMSTELFVGHSICWAQGLQRSGVDAPLSPSRARLTAFIANSVPVVFVSLGQSHPDLLPRLPESGKGWRSSVGFGALLPGHCTGPSPGHWRAFPVPLMVLTALRVCLLPLAGAQGRGGGWHKASVFGCLPLAAPIGLSPLLILTLCGSEGVLVVSTEPPDDLSCLTTPGVGRPGDGAVARAVDQGHPDAHSESMGRGGGPHISSGNAIPPPLPSDRSDQQLVCAWKPSCRRSLPPVGDGGGCQCGALGHGPCPALHRSTRRSPSSPDDGAPLPRRTHTSPQQERPSREKIVPICGRTPRVLVLLCQGPWHSRQHRPCGLWSDRLPMPPV